MRDQIRYGQGIRFAVEEFYPLINIPEADMAGTGFCLLKGPVDPFFLFIRNAWSVIGDLYHREFVGRITVDTDQRTVLCTLQPVDDSVFHNRLEDKAGYLIILQPVFNRNGIAKPVFKTEFTDLKILSDLTGDMEYDAPLIVQKAQAGAEIVIRGSTAPAKMVAVPPPDCPVTMMLRPSTGRLSRA